MRVVPITAAQLAVKDRAKVTQAERAEGIVPPPGAPPPGLRAPPPVIAPPTPISTVPHPEDMWM
eukprot:15468920-Heterocapsa_arctica.AAC.1